MDSFVILRKSILEDSEEGERSVRGSANHIGYGTFRDRRDPPRRSTDDSMISDVSTLLTPNSVALSLMINGTDVGKMLLHITVPASFLQTSID